MKTTICGLKEGGIEIYGFAISAIFGSVFVTKELLFFGFGDYCVFCSVSLSVFGKNKIGLSDLLCDGV